MATNAKAITSFAPRETRAGAVPDLNLYLSARLREAAGLLARQGDGPFRIAAYRRAADSVAGLDQSIDQILAAGGITALDAIPGIGRGIAAALAEMIHTGRWTYLERLRGAAEPGDLFRMIPGVGPKLAKLLHDELKVETLEQLEAALHDPATAHIKGIGPRRLAMLRSSLATLLSRLRPAPQTPHEEPSVERLLEIDAAYRQAAETGTLAKIAPKRFNPSGEAWLPILHATRGPWHFTALYSNTARAHELGKTSDWVVIYAHEDHGGETQRTIVTETRGKHKGLRIVRGRERECVDFYEDEAKQEGRQHEAAKAEAPRVTAPADAPSDRPR